VQSFQRFLLHVVLVRQMLTFVQEYHCPFGIVGSFCVDIRINSGDLDREIGRRVGAFGVHQAVESGPIITVERSIIYSFTDVVGLDIFAAVKIGNSAGHF